MDVEKWTSLTRPLVTLIFTSMASYLAYAGTIDGKDYLSLVTVVILFWFRERSDEKVAQQVVAQVEAINKK